MKRCSVCEFIYEDDQLLCDLDGIELPNEPGSLPLSLGVSAPKASSRSLRFLRSPFSLAALSLVGVILSALVIGYYDFVNTAESNTGSRESVGNLVPSAHAETTDNLNSQEGITAREGSHALPASEDRTGSSDAASDRVTAKSMRAGGSSRAVNSRKDSKVTKMFKKTGRLITKPFKRF